MICIGIPVLRPFYRGVFVRLTDDPGPGGSKSKHGHGIYGPGFTLETIGGGRPGSREAAAGLPVRALGAGHTGPDDGDAHRGRGPQQRQVDPRRRVPPERDQLQGERWHPCPGGSKHRVWRDEGEGVLKVESNKTNTLNRGQRTVSSSYARVLIYLFVFGHALYDMSLLLPRPGLNRPETFLGLFACL